jgi:hypothetical protein
MAWRGTWGSATNQGLISRAGASPIGANLRTRATARVTLTLYGSACSVGARVAGWGREGLYGRPRRLAPDQSHRRETEGGTAGHQSPRLRPIPLAHSLGEHDRPHPRATIREALAPDMPGACQQGPPSHSPPPSPLRSIRLPTFSSRCSIACLATLLQSASGLARKIEPVFLQRWLRLEDVTTHSTMTRAVVY